MAVTWIPEEGDIPEEYTGIEKATQGDEVYEDDKLVRTENERDVYRRVYTPPEDIEEAVLKLLQSGVQQKTLLH